MDIESVIMHITVCDIPSHMVSSRIRVFNEREGRNGYNAILIRAQIIAIYGTESIQGGKILKLEYLKRSISVQNMASLWRYDGTLLNNADTTIDNCGE